MKYDRLSNEEILNAINAARIYASKTDTDFDGKAVVSALDKVAEKKYAEFYRLNKGVTVYSTQGGGITKISLDKPKEEVILNDDDLAFLVAYYDGKIESTYNVLRDYLREEFERIAGNSTDFTRVENARHFVDEDEQIIEKANSGMYTPDEMKKVAGNMDSHLNWQARPLLVKLNDLRREQYYLYCKFMSKEMLKDRCLELLVNYRCAHELMCQIIKLSKEWKERAEQIKYGLNGEGKVIEESIPVLHQFYGDYDHPNNCFIGMDRNDNGMISSLSFESCYQLCMEQMTKERKILTENNYREKKHIVVPDVDKLVLMDDDLIRACNTIKCFNEEEYRKHCINQMHLSNEEKLIFELKADEYLQEKEKSSHK
jgi:hypothetical protein